ncbi:two-component system, NtrC family, sensor kinase [Roseovarius pacificus]|uniref:histidine kinase n=2 Tax=Roseovarius pacificus TaxID=337701 RepID=A0A1M7HYN7_9RHOB|nr:two-component sensor histidine kinase [Roseovarius pacificus]SHM33614.1 two-component system, NtrC family, sensor kinase [Roseovarius pacificus]
MSVFRTLLSSVRIRLLVIALLPMLVLLPLLLGGSMLRWAGKIDEILITKVNGDLTIADQYLQRLLENSGERLAGFANSVALRDAMEDNSARNALLEEQREKLELDFLYITNGEDSPEGFSPANWPVIATALDGRWRSAVDILRPAELELLAPGLTEKAAITLVETRAAVPTDRTVEDRGMIIHSAAPIRLSDGQTGALVGGRLLNRNLDFIDTINALVYREQSLPDGSQGTATLFLDDVRVSTNVRLFENVRALGTRVSAAVRKRVLGDGQVWLDRAFVVNDWYISAYEPIVDSHGARVGMLYVGFLEAPFRAAKVNSVLTITLLFLLITILSVPLFLRWAGHIFRPLEKMTQTIAKVEAGDMNARNLPAGDSGEIAQVASHLDTLLDRIQERDRQLREWAESLEQKVDERTHDLSEANRKLEETTEQLIMSEKLAAVGEITASVAHEINNPIAVIQGNLEVARGLLNEEADKVSTEFRLIDDQVYRISAIVSKLLQFAKPEEFSGATNVISPADVVRDCLVLTRHQIEAAGVSIVTHLDSDLQVRISRTELQQVLVNLILNGIQAMPQGGTLTIRVRDAQGNVAIDVQDTGHGIPADVLKRIFDPFYTTKQAEGTGLGLSISQKLVTRAGGTLGVQSKPGAGSVFLITLPAVASE